MLSFSRRSPIEHPGGGDYFSAGSPPWSASDTCWDRLPAGVYQRSLQFAQELRILRPEGSTWGPFSGFPTGDSDPVDLQLIGQALLRNPGQDPNLAGLTRRWKMLAQPNLLE